MNQSEELIDRVCNLLTKVKKWKWRNNAALAKELKVDEQILLKALIEETNKPGRRIQYHALPSGKKMDILWGLFVETDRIDAPSLSRSDEPETDIQNTLDFNEPFIFLSHNHRDARQVIQIRDILRQSDLNCWLFQGGIEFNELIIPKVNEALNFCSGLAVFISQYSLGSLWVQKEFGYTLKELEKPSLVIIDGTDEKLNDWLKNINSPKGYDKFKQYVDTVILEQKIKDGDQWRRIAHEFRNQFSDYVHQGGVVTAFPNDFYASDSNLKPTNSIKDWTNSIVK